MPVRKFRCLRKYAKPWKQKFANSLRRNMTMPERILWSRLRDKQLGVRLYAQSIIFGYIVDFWYPGGIVVEVDGPVHLSQKDKDGRRDAHLASRGIRTMRFTAKEVVNNVNAVVALIRHAIFKSKDAC